MADNETLQRVELALAQSKRVNRESRVAVQQLARLRDHLQPEEGHKETDNGSIEGSTEADR